ncbi:MAG: cell division protein FtsZ [Candidatus Micrarchaeota archaeon]
MDGLIADAMRNSTPKTVKSLAPSDIRISVVGVGGAGTNTVHRLKSMGLESARTIAINTDANHLKLIDADKKVLIGANLTKGMGAGGFPEIGMKAAESSREKLAELLGDNELVFITAGMGGGTGTGAAPVIADIAKKTGAITIAIVSFPFVLERARLSKADWGIEELTKVCDTVVIIDNNRLVSYVPNLPMNQAFAVADTLVARAVKGIADTIMLPSLMNIDFADLRMIMSGGGVSMISIGEGKGNDKVDDVIKSTLEHPLLDVDYAGAKGGLILIQGGSNLTLGEAVKIGEGITSSFDSNAYVKWGARLVPEMGDKIVVTAVLTGIQSDQLVGHEVAAKPAMPTYNLDAIKY